MSSTTSVSQSTSNSDSEGESMYHRLTEAVDEMGEVMVKTVDGSELELHKHSVEKDEEPFIRVEGDDETHWVDTTKVVRYWIHDEI
mgnify:FL=1